MKHTTRSRSNSVSLHRGQPPPLTSPEKWFDYTDVHHTGYICKQEVINSLFAYIRPNTRTEERFIKGMVDDSWRLYVSSSFGTKVSKHSFLSKEMNKFLADVVIKFSAQFKKEPGPGVGRQQGVNSQHSFRSLIRWGSTGSFNLMNNATLSNHSASSRNVFGSSISNTNTKSSQNNSKTPSLSKNPKAWFVHFDKLNRGCMNKQQIINALIATYDADSTQDQNMIIDKINEIWDSFVTKDDGTITKFEFLLSDGLCDRLKSIDFTSNKENTNVISSSSQSSSSFEPPNIKDRDEWFDYFDSDEKSYLSKKQLIHGLYVSLQASDEVKQNNIRGFIEEIWSIYASQDVISKNDFCRNDGLADCIINNISSLEKKSDLQQKVEGMQVQVNIPQGMLPGQRLKIQSPRTNDLIVLIIPERCNWGGGMNGTPYYFSITL